MKSIVYVYIDNNDNMRIFINFLKNDSYPFIKCPGMS